MGYKIIDFLSVFGAISEFTVCANCYSQPKFVESSPRGFGFTIVIVCQCGSRELHSSPFVNKSYELNRRIVLVMRLLGVRSAGIKLFSGPMDLGPGLTYRLYQDTIASLHEAAQSVFNESTKNAVEEEKLANVKNGRNVNEIKVSGDGS